MKKHKLQILSSLLIVLWGLGIAVQPTYVFADSSENIDKAENNVSSMSTSLDNHIKDETTLTISKSNSYLPKSAYEESKIAPALAGMYFIPGIGEVAITATGIVIAGGIVYGAGSTIYNLVKKAINNGSAKKKSSVPSVANKIPDRLKKSKGYVDLGKFNKKLRRGAKQEKKGWTIEPDRAGGRSHGGSKWKLMNKNGKRIATLADNGKILRP